MQSKRQERTCLQCSDCMTQRLYTIHLVNCLDNKTVIDRRLRPRCCRMWSYFKRTSVSCRYIRRDIMCKHDVMNIQHAHCGLVGPDRGARKVGP